MGYLTAETPSDNPAQPLRTLLLLHAFPLNADMWRPQATGLPAGWRVVAPDYRGFGGSAVSSSATMNDLAGDVVDLLDHLQIHEAVVAGCSNAT